MERQRGGLSGHPVRRTTGGQVPLPSARQSGPVERHTARHVPSTGLPPAITELNQQVTTSIRYQKNPRACQK